VGRAVSFGGGIAFAAALNSEPVPAPDRLVNTHGAICQDEVDG
jgi:hypothetical protein